MHEGRSWAIIQQHLNDTIGKQLVGLDKVHAARPPFSVNKGFTPVMTR